MSSVWGSKGKSIASVLAAKEDADKVLHDTFKTHLLTVQNQVQAASEAFAIPVLSGAKTEQQVLQDLHGLLYFTALDYPAESHGNQNNPLILHLNTQFLMSSQFYHICYIVSQIAGWTTEIQGCNQRDVSLNAAARNSVEQAKASGAVAVGPTVVTRMAKQVAEYINAVRLDSVYRRIPDIIMLNEVSDYLALIELKDHLIDGHQYHALMLPHTNYMHFMGNAVLTKIPIASMRALSIPQAYQFTIPHRGNDTIMIGAHLSALNQASRERQARTISTTVLKEIAAKNEVVLVGDLNDRYKKVRNAKGEFDLVSTATHGPTLDILQTLETAPLSAAAAAPKKQFHYIFRPELWDNVFVTPKLYKACSSHDIDTGNNPGGVHSDHYAFSFRLDLAGVYYKDNSSDEKKAPSKTKTGSGSATLAADLD